MNDKKKTQTQNQSPQKKLKGFEAYKNELEKMTLGEKYDFMMKKHLRKYNIPD